MGTWNTKSFGNDTASDWLWELEKAKDESVIEAALEAEVDGDETIAAAAVVEAARRQPVGKLPPKAKEWVSEQGFVPSDALVRQAITAVEKIKASSELRELWAESGSLKQWLKQIDLLLVGLREVESLPPPARKPKAPAPRLLDKMIEKINPDEESPLREKLRNKLEALTDLEAPVARTPFPESPLTLLAKHGLMAEAKRLVERGAKINVYSLKSPLESACKYGRAEMVKWLLEQGAIITFSVLSYAVQSGSIATVEVLVQHREYLMTEDLEKAFCQHPLLHRVVDANHPHLIEYMVKNGFDIDVRNSVGMTPLSWAANQYPESTRRKVVDKLLSLGANPNTKDNDGLTPLDLASYHDSNEEVCQFLKSHGGLLGKEIPN